MHHRAGGCVQNVVVRERVREAFSVEEGLLAWILSEEVEILLPADVFRGDDVFPTHGRSPDFISRHFVASGEDEPHAAGDRPNTATAILMPP